MPVCTIKKEKEDWKGRLGVIYKWGSEKFNHTRTDRHTKARGNLVYHHW